MVISNVYAHPDMCPTPELIWALQERLGLRAVVEGVETQKSIVRECMRGRGYRVLD